MTPLITSESVTKFLETQEQPMRLSELYDAFDCDKEGKKYRLQHVLQKLEDRGIVVRGVTERSAAKLASLGSILPGEIKANEAGPTYVHSAFARKLEEK